MNDELKKALYNFMWGTICARGHDVKLFKKMKIVGVDNSKTNWSSYVKLYVPHGIGKTDNNFCSFLLEDIHKYDKNATLNDAVKYCQQVLKAALKRNLEIE